MQSLKRILNEMNTTKTNPSVTFRYTKLVYKTVKSYLRVRLAQIEYKSFCVVSLLCRWTIFRYHKKELTVQTRGKRPQSGQQMVSGGPPRGWVGPRVEPHRGDKDSTQHQLYGS